MITSPAKTKSKMPKNLTIKKETTEKVKNDDEGHFSPTTNKMKDTFIIKNADESFDAYYAQMRKRRLTVHGETSHHHNQSPG
jgi:hypothetical protein